MEPHTGNLGCSSVRGPKMVFSNAFSRGLSEPRPGSWLITENALGCPVPIRFREGTGSAFLAQTLKTIPFVKARRAWAKRQPRPGGLGKQFRKRPERRRRGTFPHPAPSCDKHVPGRKQIGR